MLQLPAPMHCAVDAINTARVSQRCHPRRAHFVNIFRVHEPETLWFADGKLFLDRVRGIKRDLIVKKIRRLSRAGKW